MTRPRPITAPLSPAMRGALARGEGRRRPQPVTVRGLVARRLVALGSTRLRLHPTPLGRQVATMLVDLHAMREDLVTCGRVAQSLRGLALQPDVAAAAEAIHDVALRALARSRRWVP